MQKFEVENVPTFVVADYRNQPEFKYFELFDLRDQQKIKDIFDKIWNYEDISSFSPVNRVNFTCKEEIDSNSENLCSRADL